MADTRVAPLTEWLEVEISKAYKAKNSAAAAHAMSIYTAMSAREQALMDVRRRITA